MNMRVFYAVIFYTICHLTLISAVGAESKLNNLIHVFKSLPSDGLSRSPCFPTPNDRLTEENLLGFAARTRTNEEYGMPGWTRSQGTRFHKGVDILPINFEKLKQTVRIEYYDSKSGRNFSKNEPVLFTKDEIYSILDGVVVVTNKDSSRSGYGCYAMIEHRFADGKPFISMYAHLDRVEVNRGQSVRRGDQIGWMGRTSSNAGGRNYLKAIPHCHFEIGRIINSDFANTILAKNLFPHTLGGKFDPRNIQPYNPIEFLRVFHAQPKPHFSSPTATTVGVN